MANMNFFQIFTILAGLVSIASLVKANPVLLPTSVLATRTNSIFNFDSAFSAEAGNLAVKETAEVPEATCVDVDYCCILDFTHVACDQHLTPVCNANGCIGVPEQIDFSYAGVPTPDGDCINILDGNGNPTVYDQFFIGHCTGIVDSVELYSAANCKGTYWNQVNTAACYHNGGGIGSFKLIASLDDGKRQYLGGALLNKSDAFSTSAYPPHGNKASVTPADECFDKQTGAYIVGCKVERSDVSNDALAETNAGDVDHGLHHCPPMTGPYKGCSLELVENTTHIIRLESLKRCWLPKSSIDRQPEVLVIHWPLIMDRSVDAVVEPSVNDDRKIGLDRCPQMTGPYKKCHLENATHVDGPYVAKLCWLPKSLPDAQEVIILAIVCPLIQDRSVDGAVDLSTGDDVEVPLFHCPPMTGPYKSCILEPLKNATHGGRPLSLDLCWLPTSKSNLQHVTLAIVCPRTSDRSVDGSDRLVHNCPLPGTLPTNCTLTPAMVPANRTNEAFALCLYGKTPEGKPILWLLICRGDPTPYMQVISLEDSPPTQTATRVSTPTLASTAVIAARTPWPTECKDPDWCINISFGGTMCDIPHHDPPSLNVSEEGNYQCRNTPEKLNLQQFQVTYMESQTENHAPQYGELTIFNDANCKGDNKTVLGLPYCTTVPTGWGRILSYRVWLEGACGAGSIGPCPGINGGKRGIDSGADDKRAPEPSTSTSMYARSKLTTTKVTASAGPAATVSF